MWQFDQGHVVLHVAVSPKRVGRHRFAQEFLLVDFVAVSYVVRPQRHCDIDRPVSAVGRREDPPVADDGPPASGRVSAPKVNGQMGQPGELVGRHLAPAHDPVVSSLILIGQSALDRRCIRQMFFYILITNSN